MKKSIKICFFMALLVYLIFGLSNVSVAAWNATTEISGVDNWVSATSDGGIATTAQNIMGTIINVIRIVGTGIAIIMITYVAIKYMSAAPNEKAEFKKSATALIVGAIVLFAATNILGVISKFAESNIKAPEAVIEMINTDEMYLG